MFELRVIENYDKLLEESGVRILLKKGNRLYEGDGLFFPWDSAENRTKKVLLSEMVSEDPREFCKRIIELKEEYGLKVFKDTYNTITYWQHVNGITDVSMIDGMLFEDWLNRNK